MIETITMRYVGRDSLLKGETALVMRKSSSNPFVLAQFDNLQLPSKFKYGWHLRSAKDFEVLKNV